MRRLGLALVMLLTVFAAPMSVAVPVAAQSLSDILERTTYPVNYDQPRQLGRPYQDADSIDQCLEFKDFYFNETHNIWVEGLVRCKYNSKGILSKATVDGISTKPEDEQLCVNKRENQILEHGTPSEVEARRWSERCSYLGTVGGAGPLGITSTSSSFSQYFSSGTSTGSTGTTTTTSNLTPITSQTELNSIRDSLRSYQTAAYSPTSAGRTDDYYRRLYERMTDSQRQQTFSTEEISSFNSHFYGPSSSAYTPVYTGPGVQVPSEELIPSGISRRSDLSELIVFYTNATLPYVSVVSVFVFVAAGVFYILSFANDELNAKAKSMMMYVVIGIVIIFSAYTIVNTLLRFSTFEG